jgi:predicted transcriptional regulator
MTKNLVEMAAEIVSSHLTTTSMSIEEVQRALRETYRTLSSLEGSREAVGPLEEEAMGPREAVTREEQKERDPYDSIQEDKVVCLECGAEFRQLTANHLRSHHLTPREYKTKWGFPQKQPLSAKSLTRSRSEAAKERGLPENLKAYQEEMKREKEKSAEG